ncbi:MAG: hypothetical protein QXF12_06090 [Candidatus Aenigmatarchaeota archaeon]
MRPNTYFPVMKSIRPSINEPMIMFIGFVDENEAISKENSKNFFIMNIIASPMLVMRKVITSSIVPNADIFKYYAKLQ